MDERWGLDDITCYCDSSIYNYGNDIEKTPIYETIYIDFIMDGIITHDERCALNELDFTVLKQLRENLYLKKLVQIN